MKHLRVKLVRVGVGLLVDTDNSEKSTYAPDKGLVRLAVFDFDGTLLAGKSPVILMKTLLGRHEATPLNTLAIAFWGLAYKMHLPVSEAWVRGRVFRAFEGQPKEKVDNYLKRFYDEKMAKRIRPSLIEEVALHRSEGCYIVTVSATFQPIVDRMVELGLVDHAIATRMQVDENGNYLVRCDGAPVEGLEKVNRLVAWADERFGVDGWEVEWAYSDHYSDKPLLSVSRNSVAVDPDKTLRRAALRNSWRIIEE